MSGRVVHGQVQNIIRIVNEEKDDIDLTRAQAIRVYQRLRQVLYPRSLVKPTTKHRKR